MTCWHMLLICSDVMNRQDRAVLEVCDRSKSAEAALVARQNHVFTAMYDSSNDLVMFLGYF